MPNQYVKKWEDKEEKVLYDYENGGVFIDDLKLKLPNRSYDSIKSKLKAMGIRKGKIIRPVRSEIIRPDINIKPPKKGKLISLQDYHIPFHDNRTIIPVNEFLFDEQPEIIAIDGDLIDFNIISKFTKVPFSDESIEQSMSIAHNILSDIRETVPKAQIFFIEGNHEFRWRIYLLKNAPALYESYYDDLPRRLNLEKLDITYIPCEAGLSKFSHNYIKVGKYHIGHFDMARKHAGYTAKGLREEMGVDVIQAHIHRTGISPRTYLDGIRLGAEVGCMCKLNPAYMNNPDWQQGIGVIEFDGDVSNFYNIIIDNHKFVWKGKLYK